MKLYTLFETQDLENHTLFSGTYTYRPNKGVPPPQGGGEWMSYWVIRLIELSIKRELTALLIPKLRSGKNESKHLKNMT